MEKNEEVKSDVLVEWQAASRPFKKRDASFFQTIAALVFLIVVILFFFRGWLIIGATLSVVFVAYVLASVPPTLIKYQITEKGIWIDDVFYRFVELTEFWFENYLETRTLVILMPARRVGRIVLVIPTEKEKQIDAELRKRLVFREKPLKTFVDATADWMRAKIPLEEEKSSSKT